MNRTLLQELMGREFCWFITDGLYMQIECAAWADGLVGLFTCSTDTEGRDWCGLYQDYALARLDVLLFGKCI